LTQPWAWIRFAAAAAAFGVIVRTYRRYEAGKYIPSFGWGEFCDAFGASFDWLLSIKGHEAERPRFRPRAVYVQSGFGRHFCSHVSALYRCRSRYSIGVA
jgi:hypothetical protein